MRTTALGELIIGRAVICNRIDNHCSIFLTVLALEGQPVRYMILVPRDMLGGENYFGGGHQLGQFAGNEVGRFVA